MNIGEDLKSRWRLRTSQLIRPVFLFIYFTLNFTASVYELLLAAAPRVLRCNGLIWTSELPHADRRMNFLNPHLFAVGRRGREESDAAKSSPLDAFYPWIIHKAQPIRAGGREKRNMRPGTLPVRWRWTSGSQMKLVVTVSPQLLWEDLDLKVCEVCEERIPVRSPRRDFARRPVQSRPSTAWYRRPLAGRWV